MCCMVACVVGSDETGQGLLSRIILEGDIRLLWKHVPGVELDVECVGLGIKIVRKYQE